MSDAPLGKVEASVRTISNFLISVALLAMLLKGIELMERLVEAAEKNAKANELVIRRNEEAIRENAKVREVVSGEKEVK